MRLFSSRNVGDRLAHGSHKGYVFEAIKGNDIKRVNALKIPITLATIIVQWITPDDKQQHMCFVVDGWWFGSRITSRAIRDTLATWREEIDELLNPNQEE